MDNSCPATPLVLNEADSKSPLHIVPSSPESDERKSPSRDSPDSHCVICLGKLQNKSFTNSCLHQFCFQCLLQWSKVKAECPLCKQPFKSIIHNVRSNLDYDQYHVEAGEAHCVLSDFVHSINFHHDFIQVDRRFRYRSTMTREYFRELAESILARNNLMAEDICQITPMVPIDSPPGHRYSTRLHSTAQHRSRRGTTEFRKNIYTRDLWVRNLADITGRYRECTPQFYRENPAQIHRIIPWLNREVNVLLNDCDSHAAYILSQITSLLPQHSITSREFREVVEPYFGSRTDHFIHELYTFAHSVYDIAGFDQHAVYGPNPNYATEEQAISSSNEDSDIEILETIKNKEKRPRKSSKEGFKKNLLKRAKDMALSSSEPVAGPSGIISTKASETLEICDSDPDDVKILDYVKPQPEVVTISSSEEAPALSDSDIFKEDNILIFNSKKKKSGHNRLSVDEDYILPDEKAQNKNGKGKCKSNGDGLKGRQKQKYIKSRKNRSSSTDSSKSSSYGSSYPSSTEDSDRKHKRKKTKVSRKKYSRKIVSKSSRKGLTKKRRRADGLSSDVEKSISKTKKKVKSCVIVPTSKSCDSKTLCDTLKVPKTIDDRGHARNNRSPTTYWSMISNPTENEKSWRRRDEPVEKRRRKKHYASCSEEKHKHVARSKSESDLSGSSCSEESLSNSYRSSRSSDYSKSSKKSYIP